MGWLAIRDGPMDDTWPIRRRIGETVDAWWSARSSNDAAFGNARLLAAPPDTDGEGLPDVLVGRAHVLDDDAIGHAQIYRFGGDARGTAGENVADHLALTDAAEGELFGVASAGDFDGDGLGDLLVTRLAMRDGALASFEAVASGALIDQGDLNGAVVASWTPTVNASAYECATGIGDRDGDGYDDLALGDEHILPNTSSTEDDASGVWFVAGRAVGHVSALVADDAAGAFVDSLGHENTSIGRCAGRGDFDADGLDDVVVHGTRTEGWGVDGTNPDHRDAVWLLPGRDGMPDGLEEWGDHALGVAAHTTTEESGEETGPVDAIQLESSGLPDCASSITDATFCSGWPIRGSRDVAGGVYVPDWLWNARDPAGLWLSPTFQADGEFLCADDDADAAAILQSVFPQDVSAFDDSDPRWIDVQFDETGIAHKDFRVPRCSIFASMANVSVMWPGIDAPRIIDPVWQLVSPPADRVQFFDMARMIDVYRYEDRSGYQDHSLLWAIGSSADDTTWTLRTCRIAVVSTPVSDGQYRTGVWQSDYTMDIATGHARFRADDVRGVLCDHPLGTDPPL